jgi:hypothetical protein
MVVSFRPSLLIPSVFPASDLTFSAENAVRRIARLCGKLADNLRQISMMMLTNTAAVRRRRGTRSGASATTDAVQVASEPPV